MATIRIYMLMAVPSWVEVGTRSVVYTTTCTSTYF
jgi:hypothetical protein